MIEGIAELKSTKRNESRSTIDLENDRWSRQQKLILGGCPVVRDSVYAVVNSLRKMCTVRMGHIHY